MTISYEFSPGSLRKGMKAHLLHRHVISVFLLPSLGIIFTLYGLNQIFAKEPPNTSFGVILFVLGAFYLVLSQRRVSSAVKNAFKANPNERTISLTASDGLLSFKDGESTGASPFSAFVDFKICKGGLLLYPQKNIFYWIPDTAEIEGGSWQDFTKLIAANITKKL
jgi:Zn-dependent protease with chaperone function